MAVTATLYGNVFSKAFNKEIDYDSDTIKVALCTSSYTPAQTHDYFDDITNEVTGTGYTAGGATLASKTATYTSGTGVTVFDAADTTWSDSTITARYAVVYVSTGTDTTSALIGYVDFGADKVSTDGDFTIEWDGTDGVFYLTANPS
jgi:hypothetical protein